VPYCLIPIPLISWKWIVILLPNALCFEYILQKHIDSEKIKMCLRLQLLSVDNLSFVEEKNFISKPIDVF
jgi:hypothetical protein